MPLQKLPTSGLDDPNHRRRAREVINKILDHSFDDSRVQTKDEVVNGVTPVNAAYEPGNVLRYGAFNRVDTGDASTLIDSSPAVRLALLANKRIYFPPGTYYMLSTIVLSGDAVIITGEHGGTLSALASRIVYDGSGELFSATGTEFGGIYIGHLQISGGDRTGTYCIKSTRPQSVFERLHMESWNNGGIQISQSTQGSFGTRISYCKYATDGTPNAFTAFDVSVDGGDLEIRSCSAIKCNIGVDIHQGQDIRIIGCDINLTNVTYSTQSAANGQAAIRLTGTVSVGPPETRYKPNVVITENYLEACTTAVYAESAEGLSIFKNFINDVGTGLLAPTWGANIKSSCQNVEFSNNHVLLQAPAAICVENASNNKVRMFNNYLYPSGAGGIWLKATGRTDYGWNQIIAGSLTDVSLLTYDNEQASGSATVTIGGSTTAGTQTYNVNTCYWEREGRRVRYDIFISLSAKDGATAGNLTIFGLPFTTRNNATTGRIYSAAIGEYGGIDLSAGKSQIAATAANNGTSITLFECGDNVASAALTAAALTASTSIRLSLIVDI